MVLTSMRGFMVMLVRHGRALRWLALVVLLCCSADLAAKPLFRKWYTIHTPNFDVHFAKGGKKLAMRVANISEQTLKLLIPYLRWKPSERIHVLVSDDVDSANGAAGVIPYNQIIVNGYPPRAFEELGYYDDWLRVLLVHEMAHILHLDNRSGLPQALNYIFGKTYAPNQTTPNWLAEGLAVHIESKFTGSGRIHSSVYQMYLRMAVLNNALPGLDRITGGAPLKFPGGTNWYMIGGFFMDYIARRFGDKTFAKMSYLYGRRIIPYAINTVIKEVTGKTFETLYKEWSKQIIKRFKTDAKRRKRRRLTTYKRISGKGDQFYEPAFSPDGRWMVYYADTGTARGHFRLRRVGSKSDISILVPDGGSGQVAWFPNRRKIVFSQTDYHHNYFVFRDLFTYDLKFGQLVKLTTGLRAIEPHVSPDGREIVFVKVVWGQTHLMRYDVKSKKVHYLYRSQGFEQLHGPRYSPDGRHIVFSAHRDGQRDLFLFDRRTGSIVRLTRDLAMELQPRWSPDGRFVIYSADRDGVYNLYALRLADSVVLRITNVLGGVFHPSINVRDRTLVFSSYHDGGYHLGQLPYRPKSWKPAGPGSRTHSLKKAYRPPSKVYPVRSYNPWRSIYPRSWLPRPDLTLGTFERIIGFSIEGSDAVGHHFWNFALDLDLDTRDVDVAAGYLLSRYSPALGMAPGFSLFISRYVVHSGALIADDIARYKEEIISGSLGFSFSFPRLSGRHALGLSYSLTWFRPLTQPTERHDPGSSPPLLPQPGRLGGLSLNYSFEYLHGLKYSPGLAQGRSFGVSFSINHRHLGSQWDTYTIRWNYNEYVPIGLPRGSVLAMRYNGGIALGDLEFRGTFSLGGFPKQDVLRTLLDQSGLFGLYLRGYPTSAFFGNHFHLFNVEYRMPVWNIYRGVGTLPIYFRQLSVNLFADAGMIAFDTPDEHDIRVGVGAELRLGFTLIYGYSSQIRLGYAYGIHDQGGHQVYLVIGGPF